MAPCMMVASWQARGTVRQEGCQRRNHACIASACLQRLALSHRKSRSVSRAVTRTGVRTSPRRSSGRLARFRLAPCIAHLLRPMNTAALQGRRRPDGDCRSLQWARGGSLIGLPSIRIGSSALAPSEMQADSRGAVEKADCDPVRSAGDIGRHTVSSCNVKMTASPPSFVTRDAT